MSDHIQSALNILISAKSLLQNNGWCQSSMEKKGCYCLMGALHNAWIRSFKENLLLKRLLNKYEITTKEMYPFSLAYSTVMKFTGPGVMGWNDKEDRKFNEVIAVLDNSIKHIKEAIKDNAA